MTDKEAKAKRYAAAKNTLRLAEDAAVLAFLAAVSLSGVSAKIKEISLSILPNPYGALVIYAALFGCLYGAAMFWFGLYGGFMLEHKFGLSNQRFFGWLKDEAKKYAVSFIIFALFIEFLYFLIFNLPALWWLFMSLGWIFFSIVLAKLFPVMILPLFFKCERLDDDELKKNVLNLAQKSGVRVLDVFRLCLSTKTKKANAALVGIGRTRRVLLGDTLLSDYTKDETEVVIAHELAHHKLAHMWKLVLLGGAGTLVIFYLANSAYSFLAGAFALGGIADIAHFPAVMFIIMSLSILFSPFFNAYSRLLEAAADLFALKLTALPDAFISCMDKLAKQNLADPSPSRFVEIMLYDHPPISKRIDMAKRFRKEG